MNTSDRSSTQYGEPASICFVIGTDDKVAYIHGASIPGAHCMRAQVPVITPTAAFVT